LNSSPSKQRLQTIQESNINQNLVKFSSVSKQNKEEPIIVAKNTGLNSSDSTSKIYRSPSGVSINTSTLSSGRSSQIKNNDLILCRSILIEILSTWGDNSYVGLTSIEVLSGKSLVPLKLHPKNLRTDPKDMSSIGFYDDPRVSENLINGIHCTSDGKLNTVFTIYDSS
jgi:hypothetical protein